MPIVPLTNHEPSGADNSMQLGNNLTYTVQASDFGFSDANDNPANNLQAVKISSLPTGGTLTDNGSQVNQGDFISVSDIASGKLLFQTPATGQRLLHLPGAG